MEPALDESTLHLNGSAAAMVTGDQISLHGDHDVSEKTSKVLEIDNDKESRTHRPLTAYRLIRGIVCLVILVSTAFVALVILGPLAFILFRVWAVRYSRMLTSFIFGHWLAMWPYLFEKINGTNVIFYGDKVPKRERVMVMSNHRTEVDWMYIWNLAVRKGEIGSCKYALKSSVRNVPIFGWAFHILEFLPLDRKWELDKPAIESYLMSFKNPCDAFWFVLFPEGTDFTEEKLLKGNVYAKELGLPGELHHVLLPRTKGFEACVPHVHESLDAVYDLTMAYKYRCPLFIDNLFGIDPAEVHIHVRRIPMEEIAVEPEAAASWLYDAFYKKDKLLADFKREGTFPNPIHEGALDTRAFLLRLLVFTVCTVFVLRFALFDFWWLRLYMAFSVVFLTTVTFFNIKPAGKQSED